MKNIFLPTIQGPDMKYIFPPTTQGPDMKNIFWPHSTDKIYFGVCDTSKCDIGGENIFCKSVDL